MASPIKRARRERALQLYSTPEFWDELFEVIATGGGLQPHLAVKDIPYGTTHDRIMRDPELRARYDAARYRRAAHHASQIERLVDEVERGALDPKAAQVAIGARQWLAGRMDPKQWGERQQVDVQHTHTHKLHLDAIRELSKRRTRQEDVIDAEIVSAATIAHQPTPSDGEAL